MEHSIARTYKESKKAKEQGNFLRQLEFFTTKEISISLVKLPYPTTLWKVGEDCCEIYQIPIDQLEKVLNEVYVLADDYHIDITKMWESFDGEEEFLASDFKIIWFNECNYIVSPFFAETGSTAESCVEKNL